MNLKAITERSLITLQGDEVVLFLLEPTNVSVLSREGLRARVNALMHVLKGFTEIELLCLNSRESFEHNKQYLTSRMEQEPVPQIRALLEQDLRHLDEIQSRTATAREFVLLVRPHGIDEKEMYPYLNRLEKMIREQQFTVRRADREDLKRILAVYFAGDTVSEGYDDFDGQRWLMKDGRSDYRSASVMDEAKVLQTFLDLIAPAAVRFETDRYLMGNTWRCVWAVRGVLPVHRGTGHPPAAGGTSRCHPADLHSAGFPGGGAKDPPGGGQGQPLPVRQHRYPGDGGSSE